jgi:transposase InsO family protein
MSFMKQQSLSLDQSIKRTRRREFPSEMERVVPWTDLVTLVSPYRPEGRRNRQRQRRGRGQQPAARAGRPIRYEHEAPGDMLHIETKKLGRIERPSHRMTGNRRDSVDDAGREILFVAIDDHARIAFTAMNSNERTPSVMQFLRDAVAYHAGLGVSVRRLLTDNGSAFRSKDFADACKALGARHRFTRPYRPQTHGKAERFIQSAMREWACGFPYQHSTKRTKALDRWNHNSNGNRPHQGIGLPVILTLDEDLETQV